VEVPIGSTVGPIRLVDEVGILVNKVGATIGNKVGTAVVGKTAKKMSKYWHWHWLQYAPLDTVELSSCEF